MYLFMELVVVRGPMYDQINVKCLSRHRAHRRSQEADLPVQGGLGGVANNTAATILPNTSRHARSVVVSPVASFSSSVSA